MSIEWPDIIPLGMTELPEFPIGTLPSVLKCYAEEIAESYQVSVDLPALLALTTVAASLGKRVKIKASEDWVEPVNLYIAVALPPAHRKSAVFNAITKPLELYEQNVAQNLANKIADISEDRNLLQKALREAEKKAAKATHDQVREHREIVKQLRSEIPEKPTVKRLLIDDVSPEKLINLLSENDGQLSLMSAEGGIFDLIAGRYSNGVPNLDVYLKAHCGDAIRVDRIQRGPDFVPDPALTVGLAIQPDVLKGLVNKPGFRGRGLLGRFLYALPKSTLGFRKIETIPIHPDSRRNYFQLIKALVSLLMLDKLDVKPDTTILYLSPQAKQAFNEFRKNIEKRLGPGGDLEPILDWAGKLPGAVARIAALLHCVRTIHEPATNSVDYHCVKSAITLGFYLIEHANAAFQLMGNSAEIENATKIIDWIKRNNLREFSLRSAHQALKGTFNTIASFVPHIKILEDHGYIALVDTQTKKGPGRNPSPKYNVNPTLYTHNSQNCTHEPEATDSEHNEIKNDDIESIQVLSVY